MKIEYKKNKRNKMKLSLKGYLKAHLVMNRMRNKTIKMNHIVKIKKKNMFKSNNKIGEIQAKDIIKRIITKDINAQTVICLTPNMNIATIDI